MDDIDFAHSLVLLSHSHHQMQEKTTKSAETSAKTRLNINKVKAKVLRINITSKVSFIHR